MKLLSVRGCSKRFVSVEMSTPCLNGAIVNQMSLPPRLTFLSVAVRETDKLSGVSDSAILDYTQAWLNGADDAATRVAASGGFNVRTELRHQACWLHAFPRVSHGIRVLNVIS